MRFDLDKADWVPDEVKDAIRRAVRKTLGLLLLVEFVAGQATYLHRSSIRTKGQLGKSCTITLLMQTFRVQQQ